MKFQLFEGSQFDVLHILISSIKITFHVIASQLNHIPSGFREGHWKYDALKKNPKTTSLTPWPREIRDSRSCPSWRKPSCTCYRPHDSFLWRFCSVFFFCLDWNQLQLQTSGDEMQTGHKWLSLHIEYIAWPSGLRCWVKDVSAKFF